jgi:nucleoside-diphosphate-sugar epimerase
MSVFANVLITGGGGFIGSHLVETILKKWPESRITVIDNFVTGQKRNIEPFLESGRVLLIEQDLTEYAWLEEWLGNQHQSPYTLILHFASPASPPRYQAEPVLTYLVNSQVTHQLAQYTRDVKARMLFASTSEVYGDPAVHPQPESYWGNVNPNGIRSCYDEAKRMGEAICGVFARDFGADVRLIRIFNTYGPRMDITDGRVIPSYCQSVLRGEPLEVFGDGSQTRSFCYVDDLVAGILTYVERDGLGGETVNLGNPYEFTMLELADVLEEIVGHPLQRENHPLPGDDPKRRQPDISKAKQLLDWEPRVLLREGLQKTWEYFKSTGV